MQEGKGVAPLPTKCQVEAAQKIYTGQAFNGILAQSSSQGQSDPMKYWRLADEIMADLSSKDSELLDAKTSLTKVTLLNAFYSGGCGDPDKLTEWIVKQKPGLLEKFDDIVKSSNREKYLIEFVSAIAKFAETSSDGLVVFASKFSHFFINLEAFPIYDQYAYMMVRFHTNIADEIKSKAERYERFFPNFFQIKEQEQLKGYSTKQLDHYLWLAGMYVAWKVNPALGLYPKAKEMFVNPYAELVLEDLFPEKLFNKHIERLKKLISELKITEEYERKRRRKESIKKEREQFEELKRQVEELKGRD